jgi:8-oxo-dGTP pyrophosphatase MutT (NUDIX family)
MGARELRTQLAEALEPAPHPVPPPQTRLAAVLIPIVPGDEPSVIFTRRARDLPRHPGEISFPGGLQHPGDAGLRDTALRETEEELGLAREAVDVVGALEPVHTTVSGILIVPFVGMLDGRPALHPNAAEIAQVLEYPLRTLALAETPVRYVRGDRVDRGFAYEMDGATIWGATARILHSLLEQLKEHP